MPEKEPGAIRQLFAFLGESNNKMRISIFLAVFGEMFGIVPFLMVALLADELYHGTATIQRILFYSGIAAICQIIKMLLTWRSSLMSHKISFTILKNIREAINRSNGKSPNGRYARNAYRNFQKSNCRQRREVRRFYGTFYARAAIEYCSAVVQYSPDFHSGLAHGACIPNHNSTWYSLFRCHDARLWPPNGKLYALCQ